MIGTLSPDMGHTGINRNIVECKFTDNYNSYSRSDELIETLWNVNTTIMNEFIKKVSELIETLWNVNESSRSHRLQSTQELIETLWNVNNFATGSVELKLKN